MHVLVNWSKMRYRVVQSMPNLRARQVVQQLCTVLPVISSHLDAARKCLPSARHITKTLQSSRIQSAQVARRVFCSPPRASAPGMDRFDDIFPSGAQGAIFDMDGTLLASNEHRVKSWQRATAEHGLEISEDKYFEETGKSGKDIAGQLAAEQGKDMSEEEKKQVAEKESKHFIHGGGLDQSQPIPQVVDIAKAAQQRGLKLAVASGGQKDVVDKAIKDYELGSLFQTVVTSKDVPHAKPDPDIFLLAAERLGVDIRSCVIFEDAPKGIEAAERAGALKVVDVTNLPGHPDQDRKN